MFFKLSGLVCHHPALINSNPSSSKSWPFVDFQPISSSLYKPKEPFPAQNFLILFYLTLSLIICSTFALGPFKFHLPLVGLCATLAGTVRLPKLRTNLLKSSPLNIAASAFNHSILTNAELPAFHAHYKI